MEEEDAVELYDTCISLLEEYVDQNPCAVLEPDFHETLLDELHEIVKASCLFENESKQQQEDQSDHETDDDDNNDIEEEEVEEIVERALHDFYQFHYPARSLPESSVLHQPDFPRLRQRLQFLQEKPQPAQRTAEWYAFRNDLITASNAYKAFDTPASQNQLIYEKCQPLPDFQTAAANTTAVNVNTTFHWGQKYEPVSVMLYENWFQTKVGDFGCIQHDKYSFLGASPDGINIDESNPRYGRMLEIKNIVNREITGIPKKEYWVQMQLQMEVCDLDECDFLETRFIELENEAAFYQKQEDDPSAIVGVIAYFSSNDGRPKYIYKPFDIVTREDIATWEIDTIAEYEKPEELTWIRNLYWSLEEYSCVLVQRNRTWFQQNVHSLESLWSTVLKERETGASHRAPKKKIKAVEAVPETPTPSSFVAQFRQRNQNTTT